MKSCLIRTGFPFAVESKYAVHFRSANLRARLALPPRPKANRSEAPRPL